MDPLLIQRKLCCIEKRPCLGAAVDEAKTIMSWPWALPESATKTLQEHGCNNPISVFRTPAFFEGLSGSG